MGVRAVERGKSEKDKNKNKKLKKNVEKGVKNNIFFWVRSYLVFVAQRP